MLELSAFCENLGEIPCQIYQTIQKMEAICFHLLHCVTYSILMQQRLKFSGAGTV